MGKTPRFSQFAGECSSSNSISNEGCSRIDHFENIPCLYHARLSPHAAALSRLCSLAAARLHCVCFSLFVCLWRHSTPYKMGSSGEHRMAPALVFFRQLCCSEREATNGIRLWGFTRLDLPAQIFVFIVRSTKYEERGTKYMHRAGLQWPGWRGGRLGGAWP